MYKCINGWTKEKMLKVIEARRYNCAAYDKEDLTCKYLTDNGNKCAIGLFIPEGDDAVYSRQAVGTLLKEYPNLVKKMPLELEALRLFQRVHDTEADCSKMFEGNAKAAMLDWVEKNVE